MVLEKILESSGKVLDWSGGAPCHVSSGLQRFGRALKSVAAPRVLQTLSVVIVLASLRRPCWPQFPCRPWERGELTLSLTYLLPYLLTLLRSYVLTYLFTSPYFRASRQRSGHALKSAAAPRVLFGGEVLTGPGKDPGEFRKGVGLFRRGPMSRVFWFVMLWARADLGCCA